MENISVASQILELDRYIPDGWSKSSGHLVFDVKIDFTRKARWVKDGHQTADPITSTYAIVSRESLRIALTYAMLNGLSVLDDDIQKAYLKAPSSKQHYIISHEELGLENVGKVALIQRASYRGKSSSVKNSSSMYVCRYLFFAR